MSSMRVLLFNYCCLIVGNILIYNLITLTLIVNATAEFDITLNRAIVNVSMIRTNARTSDNNTTQLIASKQLRESSSSASSSSSSSSSSAIRIATSTADEMKPTKTDLMADGVNDCAAIIMTANITAATIAHPDPDSTISGHQNHRYGLAAIITSVSGVSSAVAVLLDLDDNSNAINENVDNFQNENQIANVPYRNVSRDGFKITGAKLTPSATMSTRTALATSDLLLSEIMGRKNFSTVISNSSSTTTKPMDMESTHSSSQLTPSTTTTTMTTTTPTITTIITTTTSETLLSPSIGTGTTTTIIADADADDAATMDAKWQRILSRPKRYLSFPDGSSLSVSVCFTVGIIGNPRYNYMSYGLNWGVAYDLPNTSWILNHLHGFAKQPEPVTVLRRRSRRSLYRELEMAVDNMGYNGRDCLLRALCESRQYFQKTKMTMIGEMLRVIFSLPKQRLFTRELRDNADIELYDRAYRKGRSADCSKQYNCTFSLLELAFGKYSKPPPNYYKNY